MLTSKLFGTLNNRLVTAYTIENAHGLRMTLLDYGATWYALEVPTHTGHQNIMLNTDLAGYAEPTGYFGKPLGRVAGRIGEGQLMMNGKPWPLPANEGTTTLHGGPHGYSTLWWQATPANDHVTFTRTIPSSLDGFPGDLTASVTYTLTDSDEVHIDFTGTSPEETVFNPTNHAYWNLNATDETIENHELMVAAPQRFEAPLSKVPTDHLLDVTGTPFDFTTPRQMGPQLAALRDTPERGIDDIYYIGEHDADQPVATLSCGDLGVEFYSKRNALILFTANKFGDELHFLEKKSRPYVGVALEPQTAPHAVVNPDFGDIRLAPGETGQAQLRYHFTY